MRDEVFETTRACGTGLDTPAGRAWVAFLRSHAGVTRMMDAELRRESVYPSPTSMYSSNWPWKRRPACA